MSKARWETPDIASMIRRPLQESTMTVNAGYPPGLSDPLGASLEPFSVGAVDRYMADVPECYRELYGLGSKK